MRFNGLSEWEIMFEVLEHNKSDCIKLLNMIICEIPFVKSFNDRCLLERLLNLISIITNAFDYPNKEPIDCNAIDSEAERVLSIREWLCRHYKAKHFIDELDFDDSEDRTRVTVLIINILFKLRHSLKDVEQYLKDCDSFVQFDQQLNDITRFDKLLEIVENDSNKWKSKARYYKVKVDEMDKEINKFRQKEIFNYNCNPRNQNLYKSRICLEKPMTELESLLTDHKGKQLDRLLVGLQPSNPYTYLSVLGSQSNPNRDFDIAFESDGSDISVNNEDIQYMCAQCDQKYLTNFELNLHYLKGHSDRPEHKDLDISDIIKNSNLLQTLNNNNQNHTKKLRILKKRPFKCNYRKCNKAFYKTLDLRNHFARHEPKVDKLCRKVYIDHTNSALNQLRAPVPKPPKPPKPRRVSNNNNNNNNNNNTKRKRKLNFDIKPEYNFNERGNNFDNLSENNSEFIVDPHLPNCISDDNSVLPVPLVLINNGVKRNSIDSSDYFNESTDEENESIATETELKEIFGLQCKPNPITNGSTHKK